MFSQNSGLLSALAAILFSQTVIGESTLNIPFNTTHSHGPDGPWNFITLNVGTTNFTSAVDFYPLLQDTGDLIVTQDACSSSSCIASAPNYYDQRNQMADYPDIDRNPVDIGDNWNARKMLNWHGNGYPSVVDITTPETLKNQFVVVTSNVTQALGTKSFTPVSLLSLENAVGPNVTMTTSGDNVTQLTLLDSYHQSNSQASRTFGLHIGSAPFNQTGSLTIGGYDQDRLIESPAMFNHLTWVNLTSITFNVNSSANPWASSVQQPNSNFLSSPLRTLISPHVPNLLLPDSLCKSFANFLPIQYDQETNLYLWKTDSPAYKQLISSPGNNMNFTFGEAGATSASIRIPFALLDLTLTAPVKNTPTQYFPCEQHSDTVNLGRAFMQGATLIQSFNPTKMWIGQAPGPGATGSGSKRSTPNIQSLSASNPTVKAASNPPKWEDTWSGQLPLNKSKAPAATAPAASSQTSAAAAASQSSQASQGLTGGAIAGLIIGVIVLVAMIAGGVFFFLRRRKAQRAGLQKGDMAMSEADSTNIPAPSPKYTPATQYQYSDHKPKELSGAYSSVTSAPAEMDVYGYGRHVQGHSQPQQVFAHELGDTSTVHAHQLP